jgi:hypothetical protein
MNYNFRLLVPGSTFHVPCFRFHVSGVSGVSVVSMFQGFEGFEDLPAASRVSMFPSYQSPTSAS